jgi:hypothetical protein
MASILVVEDGTIVEGANSYATLVEARAYALARGVTLSAIDTVLDAQMIKGIDYLEAKRARYQGSKVEASQALQFPRSGVVIDGFDIAAEATPALLKPAQIQLAMQLHAGVDLMPTSTGPFVIEDTVGPLTTKYSDKVGVNALPEIPAVDALLEPLFQVVGISSGRFLTTVRV